MSKSMIKISFLHCKRLYVRKNAQIIPIPETNKTVRDDSESNGKNRNDKKTHALVLIINMSTSYVRDVVIKHIAMCSQLSDNIST